MLVPGDEIEYELIFGYDGDPNQIAARKVGDPIYSEVVDGKSFFFKCNKYLR